MALTNTGIKNLKPTGKPKKYSDGQGMYLLVNAAGKYWRIDYAFAGKRKTLALGTYPDVSLESARKRRTAARELLAEGVDPGAAKRQAKNALVARHAATFEVVATEWLKRTSKTRKGNTETKLTTWLINDIYPLLGRLPVAEITAPDVKRVLDRLHARDVGDTLRRVHGLIGRILKFAATSGYCSRAVTVDMKLGDLYPAAKTVSHSAIELAFSLSLTKSYLPQNFKNCAPTIGIALDLALVLMHSKGLYSAVGTILVAAAWTT